MKRLLRLGLLPAILFLPSSLLPQGSANLKVIAHIDPAPPAPGWKYGEVTGAGDLAIIGGFAGNSYVWIYDLSNKTQPVLMAAIPIDTPSWDVQVHGRNLFIALSGRMEWYDILEPAQPKLVKRFEPDPPINPHTFFVAGNTLYVADIAFSPWSIRVFDIADKKNPRALTAISDPAWNIHDMTVIRRRLYGAWIFGNSGLLVSNVANPATPKELAAIRYPQAATHNAWPTEDEKYILTTDEVAPTRNNLKVWDARTPGRLTQVAEREVANASSPIHNVYVRGNYAYASYYCEGLRIFDINDPTRPREVAFYDFNINANCAGFGSNWGVYPFANLIYASDMNTGLYVLEFADHPAANFTGTVLDGDSNKPVRGATVYFRDEYPTTRTNSAGGFDIPWFKNDTVKVVTEAPDYRPDTTTVITSAANKTTATIRLRRLSTSVNAPQDIPAEFDLLASYPNPLSSAGAAPVQIVFRLPVRAEVQLEIFNIFGQRVRELLRAAREPGEHPFTWDGTADNGQTVPSGVYLLRLRAGTFSSSRRITVLR
jgi:hypothetical protein